MLCLPQRLTRFRREKEEDPPLPLLQLLAEVDTKGFPPLLKSQKDAPSPPFQSPYWPFL